MSGATRHLRTGSARRALVASLVLHGMAIGLAAALVVPFPGRAPSAGLLCRIDPRAAVAPPPPPESPPAPPVAAEAAATEDLSTPVTPWPEPEDRTAPSPAPVPLRQPQWLRPLRAQPQPATPPPPREATPVPPAAPASPTVMEPRPIADNPPPDYPAAAVRAGRQGRVVLEVEVRADGTVGDCTVVASSGHLLLDHAAVDAVRRWRFRDGPGRVRVPIEFVLRTAAAPPVQQGTQIRRVRFS